MLRLTDAAAAHARTLAESRACDAVLRVRIVGGGCAGHTWDVQFGNVTEIEGDIARTTSGVKVVVDVKSARFLRGAWVDLGKASTTRLRMATDEGPTDFVLRNLAAKHLCGCGESFEA